MSIKKISKSYLDTEQILFKPLPEKRTFKEIAEQIRHSIFTNILSPGDKLPSERELAKQFNVGRISVREALRMLEQAGLIFIKQGSSGGAYVKEADTTVVTDSVYDLIWRTDIRLEDLTEARLAVEKQVLQYAFDKITGHELKLLGECIDELEKIVQGKISRDTLNHYGLSKFHLVLARATKNPVFEILLKILGNVTIKVLDLKLTDMERIKKHLASHKAIYKALKSHDLDKAIKAMEKHLLDVKIQYSGMFRKRKSIMRG